MNRVLLQLDDLPVYQNRMYSTAAAARACPRGALRLELEPRSGVVHNADFDPALLTYDQSYQNEQSHSPSFRAHLDDVLDLVHRHFAGGSILEVGCGKGAFVELMRARGHRVRGVDPAYEGSDPDIERALFAPGSSSGADAIVLRHTLEHIRDPRAFLALVRAANGGRGLIYVEVPCLDWILAHRAWFDFFYEHVNYFRLGDFARLFGRVVASGRLFGGQYLYAIADLATLRDDASLPPAEAPAWPPDLFAALQRAGDGAGTARSVVWGAAAKGVMFAHHALRHGVALEFAIDINPAKQGAFLAGTGLEVLSPAQGLARLRAGDRVHVMNSNYLDEIVRTGGADLVYLPVDRP
jgi:SAM-dependent methyltransferase